MPWLRSLAIEAPDDAGFPFGLPSLRGLNEIDFAAPITLLVGENGSGKSTFLEALAWSTERVVAGSESIDRDDTLEHVLPLGRAMRTGSTCSTSPKRPCRPRASSRCCRS